MGRIGLGYGVALCALLSSACADKKDGEVSARQDFAKAFAQRVCAAIGRCCEHQSHAVDRASCEKTVEGQIASDLQDYESLKVSFDSSAAEACIADYANAACLEQPTEEYDLKRNCKLIFQGLVPPGGACRKEEECSAESNRSGHCLDGTCALEVAPPKEVKAGAGEPCGGTCKNFRADDGCVPGGAAFGDPELNSSLPRCFTNENLQCAGRPEARTCQPLIPVGESCAGSSQGCAPGSFCDLGSRLCLEQTDSGACGSDVDACTASSACDFDTGRCVPVADPVGSRCQANDDCRTGYCNPSAICQEPLSETFCAEPKLN